MTARYFGLDYLRAFLIVRLVALHSVLAYADFGSPLFANIAPITDSRQWSGFEVFVRLNETFSMSLMYFISGLFVWSGLTRRGALGYALARGRRLGVPFALVAILVMPLAFYPSFLSHGLNVSLFTYFHVLVANLIWPAGSLWFIWLLLMFDLCAAAVYQLAPGAFEALGRMIAGAARRPAPYFFALVAVAAILYVPMIAIFGPFSWIVVGPFALQTSRLFHYALYFFAGVGIGAYGLGRGPLADDSLLIRHWGRWLLLAVVLNVLFATALYPLLGAVKSSAALRTTIYGVAVVATCAATSFGLLALFRRFLTRPFAVATSLAASSYGIYLVHDFFVLWPQYLLLGAAWPAVIKALVVFAVALTLSWGCTALARRLRVASAGRSSVAPAVAGSPQPGQ
ncbi:MAG TPA: acyltransferase [Stellaceae bacterium]|nr:acyltransferase [Stellaceae bacterium]